MAMNNAPAHHLKFALAPRVPMRMLEFQYPMRAAAQFSFRAEHVETNFQTYYADAGEWNMPFKILRSSSEAKPILMLLHGLGLHPASFRGITAYLLKVCDLIVVDYTGFTSLHSWPDGGAGLRVLAHAIMRIPAALGLNKIHIGGSSLGGGLSIMAAVDFPTHIHRIVLFNPAIFPQRLPSFYQLVRVPILGPLIMRFMPPPHLISGVTTLGYVDASSTDEELIHVYEDNMKSADNRLRVMDLIRHLPEREVEVRHYLSRARALPHEVLLIWGEQDKLLAAGTGARLRDELPHIDFHSFPDLAHLPHEESPDRIGPIVAEFIVR